MNFINLVNSADEAVKNKEFQLAIKLLKNAFEINPKSFEVCSKLGILTFQLGKFKDSINYFKKTTLIDHTSTLGYSNLGLIYNQLNNKELALKNYLKALEINPKNFLINYNLANFFFSNNDDENAEKYYLLSIELNSEHFYSYNNLFELYDRTNNLNKLEKTFTIISKKFAPSPEINFLEGILQFKKKNYERVIELFKNLNIDKKNFQKNILRANLLAKSYDHIGLYNQAYEFYLLSNKIIQNSFQGKFDKNKFNNLISKRLNFVSKINNELNTKKEILDNHQDPVFLIGMPRSGTTLLDTILRTHKCIKVLEEKQLVNELIDKLTELTHDNLLNLNSINKDIILKLRDIYFKKRNNLIGYSKDIIYIDKLPLNIIYIAELKIIFPNSKFIFALRHPCDTVLSCFMQPFLPNDAMSNFYNLEDASEFYDLVMNLYEKYQENLNLNLHIVKYEEVVNDFDNSLKKILKFLNLNWNDELRNFHLTASKRGIINTPSYNQVNKPLYNQSIFRWKNYSEKLTNVSFKLEKWLKKFEYL
tara:strand:+ start:830 stop:2431 length:1602 start_codon:yes stop_codon:yes gene_type:complete